MSIISSKTRKEKDSENDNKEITELIETVKPSCTFKEYQDCGHAYNYKTFEFLCSPQLALFIHPESEAGKALYDQTYKQTASAAVLYEVMVKQKLLKDFCGGT